jgi:outer membrane protein assembly factor BamA
MRQRSWLPLSCLVLLLACAAAQAQVIRDIRLLGNFTTADEEVLRLAGIAPGAALNENAEREIERRLLGSGRFQSVSVVRRYSSLSDTAEVILLITVREKERIRSKWMFMPILSGSDEYGLTYGVRISAVNLLGPRDRLSFPLTWGGERRAAAEAEFDGRMPPVSTFFSGAGLSRVENPHFEMGDFRKNVWGGARRRLGPFTLEFSGGWSDVDFGTIRDRLVNYGADLQFDTRPDLNLPRDAVFLGLGWRKLALLEGKPDFNRYKVDLRGYKGLLGQSILAGQFVYHASDGRLPDYERPFLGGASTLRGHQPGAYIGDNIALTSLELRLPVTSPLAVYHAGFDFFWDSGAVFDHGQSLSNADFRHGAGVGVFFLIMGFGVKVDLAHDLNDSIRVHFSTGFRF